jgi:NADH-quinone oxidoreductase subunit N
MYSLTKTLLPEFILTIVAAVLFLLGTSRQTSARKLAPWLALLALAAAFISQLSVVFNSHGISDPWITLRVSEMSRYVKLLASAIGILLTLLAWPTSPDATSGKAVHYGTECGEFFGLILLSIVGVFLVAGANDMMLLFLGLELASLPTYIMVSISRPTPLAQEAGVKYFFLGALSAALMLLGFSYLYGTTGTIYLHGGTDGSGVFQAGVDTALVAAGSASAWQMLAAVILIVAFTFKIVAVPMHVYAADVYQGAATPVTALLSFVPKIAGFVALLKVLYAIGGSTWAVDARLAELLWWIAVLTMCFGNVLGLLQKNIKRVFAYSSISHSGYMLVGVTALVTAGVSSDLALRGVLFYLLAYGLTNIAAFGVLALLPASQPQVGSSAETFDEISGLGRQNIGLGLAMSAACFSLIGIPLTVGFFGKVLLIQPALQGHLYSLVAILVINSAISAAYYLRIIGALFLRPATAAVNRTSEPKPLPVMSAIVCSAFGVLILGTVIPLTDRMVNRAGRATNMNVVDSAASERPVTAMVSSRR